jgi:hypothetical protein
MHVERQALCPLAVDGLEFDVTVVLSALLIGQSSNSSLMAWYGGWDRR